MKWPNEQRDKRKLVKHEHGTWVYAFYLTHYTTELFATARDEFIRCDGVEQTIMLPSPAFVTSPNKLGVYPRPSLRETPGGNPAHQDDRELHLRRYLDAGAPVVAAICLGSSPSSWVYEDKPGSFWSADLRDLTRPGRRLLRQLDKLYGPRPFALITYVTK